MPTKLNVAGQQNWQRLVKQALEARGFCSVIDFARSNETATFYAIAQELGEDEIAPVQIEKLLRSEAEQHNCYEYFVRSSLVRQLHHYVPNGFRRHGEWKLIRALSSWVAMAGTTKELERRCSRVGDRIQHGRDIPPDWLPSSVDDPILERAFREDEVL